MYARFLTINDRRQRENEVCACGARGCGKFCNDKPVLCHMPFLVVTMRMLCLDVQNSTFCREPLGALRRNIIRKRCHYRQFCSKVKEENDDRKQVAGSTQNNVSRENIFFYSQWRQKDPVFIYCCLNTGQRFSASELRIGNPSK